jgi:hypothetical protein
MGSQRVFNPLVGCGATPCEKVDLKKQNIVLRPFRPSGDHKAKPYKKADKKSKALPCVTIADRRSISLAFPFDFL